MVVGVGGIAAGLFLFSLWVCQHHRPRHLDVRSVPGRHHCSRSSALPRSFAASLFFKSCGFVDALRNYISADLFRWRLCESKRLVATRLLYVGAKHSGLGRSRLVMVEGVALVVSDVTASL